MSDAPLKPPVQPAPAKAPLPMSIPRPTPGKPVRYTSGEGLPEMTTEDLERASEEALRRFMWGGLR